MVPAGKKMPQLVRQQNGHQGNRERQTSQERRGILIQQLERANKFVQRSGLIVRKRDAKMSTGNQAGHQREQEKPSPKTSAPNADNLGGGVVVRCEK